MRRWRTRGTPAGGLLGVAPTNRGLWSQRLLAWAGIAVLVAVVSFVTVPRGNPDLVEIAGPWTATVDGRDTAVVLPGLFANQGFPADARVVARRTIELPDDGVRRTLWIEKPQYAVVVRWDGRELDRGGDPDAPRGDGSDAVRTDAALQVPLPDEPGPHTLELDLKGDWDEGGVTGRILVGPRAAVRAVAWQAEADKLGLSLMLALLGIVQLGVATRPRLRPAHLLFGLFACALSVWAFGTSDTAIHLIPGFVVRSRLRRMAEGGLVGLGVAFSSSYFWGSPRRAELGFLGVALVTAVAALALPADALYALEELQDGLLVVSMLWFCVIAAAALRQGVRGAAMLAFTAFPPLVVGAVGDIVVSHGLAPGGSFLSPAFILFVSGVAVSLVVRHADDANRHERLLEGSADALVSVDAKGRVTDANPAAEAMLGALTGVRLGDLVHPADQALVGAHLARGLARGDRAEFRLARPRRLVVESIATPLDDGAALLVLRDVTERRKLDQGMLRAARMEVLGVLVGGIAHDFNNMLGTLLAQIGFLEETVPDEAARERLARMEHTVERASALIRRMLTVSRGTAPQLDAVAVAPTVRAAGELVEPTLPKGVRLHVDVSEELPAVLGAASDVEQVLVNLLVNARDALEGRGGTVTVRAAPFALPSGARGVAVAVEDDGPGVPDDLKDEIFLPFVTTKSPRRGTGLGLAVSAQILKDHHGRLWVEDRPGGGARFCVALRCAASDDEAPVPLPARRDVLLVEDEPALLEGYARALREAGYTVAACASAEEAIPLLTAKPPDVLVTDVVLPGASGLDLAARCQELHPDVPVLLVSGFIPADALESLGDAMWYRLDKPVRPARLVATVGRVGRARERAARGEADTAPRWLYPPLTALTGAELFDAKAEVA